MKSSPRSLNNTRKPNLPKLARYLSETLTCCRQTSRWLPLLLDYAGLRGLFYPYEIAIRDGGRVTLREHLDAVVFWMMFAREHYPVRVSDRVIIDVGANVGMFTLYAANKARAARIVAVEPFPDTYQRLSSLVKKNSLDARVATLNCAVGSTPGIKKMDSAAGIPSQYRRIHAPETATLNLEHRGPAAHDNNHGVDVHVETLERVFDLGKVDTADLLKMNIHGSEYEVLLSTSPAVLRRCRRIAVQYHEMPAGMNLGKRQLFDHLRGIGFSLLKDDDSKRGVGVAVLGLTTAADLEHGGALGTTH